MGIFDFIASRAVSLGSAKVVPKGGSSQISEALRKPSEVFGKGYVDNGQSLMDKDRVEHVSDYSVFRKLYNRIPLLTGAINKTVDFVVAPGFNVKSSNDGVVKESELFFKKVQFDEILRRVVRDMLIYGDSFVELVGKAGLKNLKVLDPETMFVKRNDKGKILGYVQDMSRGSSGLQKKQNFRAEQIAHFKYNAIGDDAYGTSMILSMVSVTTGKWNMENSMVKLLDRKSNAPLHLKMGSDKFPASQAAIDAMANDLQTLDDTHEFVTNHTVEMEVIGFEGKILDIRPYAEYFDNQMAYGTEVPIALLGQANVNEGLARIQLMAFERRVNSIQQYTEKVIEERILYVLVRKSAEGVSDPAELPEFDWGSPTSTEKEIEVNILLNVLRTPITTSTKVEVENKIRSLLGVSGEVSEAEVESAGMVGVGAGPAFGAPPDKNAQFGGQNKPGNKTDSLGFKGDDSNRSPSKGKGKAENVKDLIKCRDYEYIVTEYGSGVLKFVMGEQRKIAEADVRRNDGL